MAARNAWATNADVTLGMDTSMRHHDVVVWANGEAVKTAHIPATAEGLDSMLRRLPGCRVRAVYEAGPDGFGLYRDLRARGIECKVVAPSMVPVEPGLRKRKNNQRDARRLGLLYDQLRAVRVPPEEEEADRQLLRTRRQLLAHQQQLQCQVQSLLRFTGRKVSGEPGWGSGWTRKRMIFLKALDLGQASHTDALQLLVALIDDVMNHILEADGKIHRLACAPKYKALVRLLRTVKGVGELGALTFITEIGDPSRFRSPAEVGAYLGLVPGENSTGEVERLGPIIQTGNHYARRVLVQIAWVWLQHDARAQTWTRRYLSRRWGAAGARQKAITALARKLAIILWAMWRDGAEYEPLAQAPLPSPRQRHREQAAPSGRGEAPTGATGQEEKRRAHR
jgi:transposase